MFPKNFNEPMGAPAIFEKQIEIKLLHPASTEGVTDSGCIKKAPSEVHREAQLEGNPSLVRSWNEAVDFWRASRRVGRRFCE
ncbi:MAG: hypothetical protein P8X89_12835 [Reinekea sp.]